MTESGHLPTLRGLSAVAARDGPALRANTNLHTSSVRLSQRERVLVRRGRMGNYMVHLLCNDVDQVAYSNLIKTCIL